MCDWRQGQSTACMCVCVRASAYMRASEAALARRNVCIQVWVYVLSKSIMPFQRYSQGVPSATNAVPDHGVNNLIFNAAVHYAERLHMNHQHPLTQCGTHGEGWRKVRSGAQFRSSV